MQQTKFSLTPPLAEFLDNYRRYGFPDKSAMVRSALTRLQHEIELQDLRQSAALYAEVYEADRELQALTETGLTDWPE